MGSITLGGTVASWLAQLPPDRAVRVQVLAGDIVLCSWSLHATETGISSGLIDHFGCMQT